MNLHLDHLVYAVPDLEASVERLERLLGVRASEGGRHAGRGTRNALIALGPASYLEILGPDPEQPGPELPRWFGVDELDRPRLARWAAAGEDLEAIVARARLQGVDLGPVISGSRRRPDGALLTWRFTDPRTVVAGGLVPFFIDWGASPHPAAGAAAGAVLTGFEAEHPDPERVRRLLEGLAIELPVAAGPAPALAATIRGPAGTVELR